MSSKTVYALDSAASDLGPFCFLRSVYLNVYYRYGKLISSSITSICGLKAYKYPRNATFRSVYKYLQPRLGICRILHLILFFGKPGLRLMLRQLLRGNLFWETSYTGQRQCWLRRKAWALSYPPPLRKHAYSNILKLSPPKTESFQIKILIFFLISVQKHRLWVLVRTASTRRF